MKLQDLASGDLLFTADRSDMGQAIQNTTGAYSHVAIYLDGMIYEATKENGVSKQDLENFLARENQRICVYRYEKMDCLAVLKVAEKHLGKPYNHSFYPNEGAFYCSQYIAEMLPIFETVPMSFGDGKQLISDFWQHYFEKLQLPVPVGQPGTNPNQLAKSKDLTYIGELDDHYL